ncbi:LPS export ABC transporter permease LptF [Comamonas sp. GB3 AK4-5]|uniref:LPS export ABC transporter permease LptF n=1 Tax=Comamonas sp. GB3 AK4-5 TaxID=3231487 RepID=UPI00351EF61A
MLFDSSIRKELARSFGATLVVLITVVMTMMLIRTLGQAAKGSVSPSDVLLVMGFTVLSQLSTILMLSLFVAIVGTLTRMYRDSEMVIWFASGRGLASLYRPLLRFSWPVVLIIGLLSLWVWPWSNQQVQQMREQFEQRSDVDRIAPGEFQESANGQRVFFIDKESLSAESASNVFIVDNTQGKEVVTSSKSARLQIQNGDKMAVLVDGQRVETKPDNAGLRISQFQEYSVRLSEGNSASAAAKLTKAKPTLELVGSDNIPEQAELGWRIGLPLAAINFVLLALAITSANPRAGKSTSLAVALLAFVIYYNLMTLGQSWVGSGRLTMPSFVLGLHGVVLLIGGLALLARHHRWSPAQLLPRRKQGAAA